MKQINLNKMKWIKFSEQQPDPIDGHYYLVVSYSAEEDPKGIDYPHSSDVMIWEWGGCYEGVCGWHITHEMVKELGGMPTHWAHIEMHGL